METRILNKKGAMLLEVIIASSILLFIVLGVLGSYGITIRTVLSNTKILQSNFLLEEGAEVLRSMRDDSWSNITALIPGTEYSFLKTDSDWSIVETMEYVGIFERTFSIEQVLRNGQSDISGTGSVDLDIIKATINVSWYEQNATTTKSISLYLANIF